MSRYVFTVEVDSPDVEWDEYDIEGAIEGWSPGDYRTLNVTSVEKHVVQSPPKLKILVVPGVPEVFTDINEAEERAEELTVPDKQPHTLILVNADLVDGMMTTEYVGVRLMSTKDYRDNHRKD